MKPFFNRLGNKYPIRYQILTMIPEHRIYAEPFVGSGAILLNKEPSEEEIINDKDSLIFEGFNLLKEANTNIDEYHVLNSVEEIQELVNAKNVSKENELLQKLYISSNTFSAKGTGKIYTTQSGLKKLKNISKYKDRLKNVQIFNKDYKEIIHTFDSKETFFFLDPPYENRSKNLYKNQNFNYHELNEILLKMKGKFLLTLNESENIRNIFQNFKMKELTVNSLTNNGNIGGKNRMEIIITNY